MGHSISATDAAAEKAMLEVLKCWYRYLPFKLVSIYFQGAHADSKNAKKKNNKKTNKNKSSISRANKKKPGMPNVANDLSQKLYATMEKHKEVSGNADDNIYLFILLFIPCYL